MQIPQLAATCRLSFDPTSFIGRRQADDDDEDDDDEDTSRVPLLPNAVSIIARALNGGPFDYDGKCITQHFIGPTVIRGG